MKKLLSIALCICLTLAAVFTAEPSFATKANADTEAAQALIGSYVNGGNYIKDTQIYTEATGAEYFHAGADSTTRRTVYSKDGTQLFMTTGENVYGAGYRDVTVDEVKKVERYYTDESGEHRSYLVNQPSIKDWFTDLEEMATLGTWSLVDGKYESTLQAEHKQLWRDFVAPMWIGSADVFTKVVMFNSAGLVLQLCNEETVFAQAIITLPVSEVNGSATISFESEAQRVSQDSNSQVWKNDDVTFTNNKTSGSSAVVSNVNPVRIYKNSTITIEAPSPITSIVFDSATGDYLNALTGSLEGEAANGSNVTLTLDGTSNTYEFTASGGQIRLNSITVNFGAVSNCVYNYLLHQN